MATPSKKGCNPAPANAKKFGPRWVRKVLTKNSSMKCAMQYATIEFMPTATSGNAHFLKPFTSITQLNAARNRKQMPPLKMVQEGVQMRFTTGQMPEECSARPRTIPTTPAKSSFFIGTVSAGREPEDPGIEGADSGFRASRNQRPAIRPRIIVPSVGMKLSVRYPPSLYTKGCSRGNRFRNHWSKRLPKL